MKYHMCKLSLHPRSQYALNQIKRHLSLSVLKMLYYALIYHYLSNRIVLWGSVSKSNLKRIVVLQKKAVRIITKSHYNAHTDKLFNSLK